MNVLKFQLSLISYITHFVFCTIGVRVEMRFAFCSIGKMYLYLNNARVRMNYFLIALGEKKIRRNYIKLNRYLLNTMSIIFIYIYVILY